MRMSRGDVFKLTTLDRHWDEGGKTPNPWTSFRSPPDQRLTGGYIQTLRLTPLTSNTERRI